MAGELTERARNSDQPREGGGDSAFEIVYEFEAKGAAKAYKRFLWRRMRRAILIASGISLACLVAIFAWETNLFLILGTAYPAAYVVLWLTQVGQVDVAYEPLDGRKIRLLLDRGGLSCYFGNTLKRVLWLGVSLVVGVGDYYFIYYERDSVPGGSVPRGELSDEALAFLRSHTRVED
jgi:hypothetical protein